MSQPDPSSPVLARLDRRGLLAAIGAFAIWGLLPLYLKLLHQAPVFQIMTHRVVWCCLFVFGWLGVRGTGLLGVVGLLIVPLLYVLTGQAAAERHGPALLVAAILGAAMAGLASGIVGAAAGWLANRSASKQVAIARAPAGRRRKFP